MTHAQIISRGIYLPKTRVTNRELENMLHLENGFVEKTTGIIERRWSNPEETIDYMAAEAAVDAVEPIGVRSIDAFFFCRDAMLTRRAYSLVPRVKKALKEIGVHTEGAFSVDTINYCAGYAQACNLASLMVEVGQINNALVIASTNYNDLIVKRAEFYKGSVPFYRTEDDEVSQISETKNPGFQDPSLNAFLWGCGAGAVLIGKGDRKSIIGAVTESNHRFSEDNFTMGDTTRGESFCVLDGSSIYKYAVSEIPAFVKNTTGKLGLDLQKTKFVTHQPQPRMLERLAEKIGIPRENLMVSCDYLGNCTAASLPITYHLARQKGLILPGDDVAFLSFGDSYLTASMFAFREEGK